MEGEGRMVESNPASAAPLIRTWLGSCISEIHYRFLLIKGKEFCGYNSSLFKNVSD